MSPRPAADGTEDAVRPLRVLVVTTWFPSAAHPAQAPFILGHVQAIMRRHEVRVIHLALGGRGVVTSESYGGIRIRRIPVSPADPVGVLRAVQTIRRSLGSSDVLHTMAFSAIPLAAFARAFASRPWVHSEHWSGVARPESVGRTWAALAGFRRMLRLPDRLTGVSSQLAGTLARFGRRGAVSVVPCVIENPDPVTAALFGDQLELMAVGALIEGKRPKTAVRTVQWLAEHGHPARLTWIGGGPLAAEVEALAAELGVSDRVSLAGVVQPAEVLTRLESADLFFLPTAHETFLASAAEALSCGRAVVLPDGGGYRDFVDASNGVLVDSDSPEAFGRALVAAAEQFAGADAHAIADPIRERFSADAVGRAFDGIYRELTVRRSADSRSSAGRGRGERG